MLPVWHWKTDRQSRGITCKVSSTQKRKQLEIDCIPQNAYGRGMNVWLICKKNKNKQNNDWKLDKTIDAYLFKHKNGSEGKIIIIMKLDLSIKDWPYFSKWNW